MNEATAPVPPAIKEIKLSPADEARFWSKVDKSGGPDSCWIWTASVGHWGHGQFHINRKMYIASRVAWVLANGKIPHDGSRHGLHVCHKCDNPPCCNPAHLFLGTHADNMRDMLDKGRHNSIVGDGHYSRLHPERLARGDRHGSRTKPGRLPRGDDHHSRLRPGCMARGEKHHSHLRPECVARGESHGSAKLTAEQVLEIRALYKAGGVTLKILGDEFGVHLGTISNVINHKIWKHI